jgi:glyoxylate/hydroxypyruvate reductase
MSLLVAITQWQPEPWIERFRRLMPERAVVALGEPFNAAEVRYAASWKHPPGSLAALPNLQYVVLHCLMHLRRQRAYDAQQRQKLWLDDRFQPGAHHVRVGIMGLGVLGQDAAKKLGVMGFEVAGWSRSPRPIEGIETFSGAEGLDRFLARTDILVCLLPLTQDTRGILNRSVFARLARDGRLGGPVVINAGRGGLQVAADILGCLSDGTLAAATLDVFETEPLPPESPLWTHPAVTITPHNAAMSDPESIAVQIAEQIRNLERGEPLRNIVDPKTGY